MKAFCFLAFAVCVLVPLAAARAESGTPREKVNSCNGIISNRPCSAVPRAEHPTVSRPSTPEEGGDRHARFMFNEFDLRRLGASREYGVEVSPATARDLCLGPDAELERCRDELRRLNERLDELVAAAKRTRDNDTGGDEGDAGGNQTIVIQNNGWEERRDPFDGRVVELRGENEKFISPTEQNRRLSDALRDPPTRRHHEHSSGHHEHSPGPHHDR